MNKILLSHSYFLRFDPKQYAIGLPYAPLGTLYAAALLREKGYGVSVFDVMFSDAPGEVSKPLSLFQPDIFVMYDDGFNYLTKMCLTNMREASFEMLKKAKAKGCITIVSSSDATDHYKDYLEQGADFILIGEGEITLNELVDCFKNGSGRFDDIPGLAFKKDGTIIKTQPRSVLKNLDELPLPAWDLIDLSPYKNSWLKKAGYFSINVATTRGCPFKCNWCAKPIYGNRYNSRSPENVLKELKLLKDNYSFDHIWFCDDIFGLKPGWVKEFSEKAEQQNMQLNFKIQSRADLLIHEDYVKHLALSGCKNVWMGAESGSQKVLDAMDKGILVDQIYKATALLKQYKIKPSFFIQFGYPGEVKEDIALTVKMINELLPHEIGISVSYPLPGTNFYEKVKSEMQRKSNWTDSDEMALMFSNNFKPAFYKQLHKYVHKSYRKQIAINNLKRFIKNPLTINAPMFKKVLSSLYYIPATMYEHHKLTILEKA